MKTIVLILTVLLLSCNSGKHRPYVVYTSYGSGWNRASTYLYCDSVKLFDPNHACVYIDGTATNLYAAQILVSSN